MSVVGLYVRHNGSRKMPDCMLEFLFAVSSQHTEALVEVFIVSELIPHNYAICPLCTETLLLYSVLTAVFHVDLD